MVDPIFNMFKTKFTVMDKLKLLDVNADRVDVYINLESIFKVLMTPRINNYLIATCENNNIFKINLMSNIVNLAQHYRLYFAKYGKDSRVFLFWNFPKGQYKNNVYIQGYREYYNHKMFKYDGCEYITRSLSECHEFMKKLFNYINQVYLINGDTIDSSVVPYIIEDNIYSTLDNTNIQKIIISNSKYDFQFVCHGFTILETNRDNSCIVTKDNVIDVIKTKMNIKNESTIPIGLLPFALSLLGDRYRNIPKLSGIGLSSIIKMVNKALDNVLITENTQDIEMLSKIISEKYRDKFIKNYLCTDVARQYLEVTPLEIQLIERQIVDKFDDNALQVINEKYFKTNPLMIINTKTEQVIKEMNPHQSMWDKK